jgi:hypothetical protein
MMGVKRLNEESAAALKKQLADQDLIQLNRKVGEIAKIYVDQGKISKDEYQTIGEISSWIKMENDCCFSLFRGIVKYVR